MDRRFFVIALVLAVLALIAVAAIGSGTDEKEKEMKEIPAQGLTLDRDAFRIEEGGSAVVKASVFPAGCTDAVAWESSDAGICTVSGGRVTGVSPGSAVVKARCGGFEATCQVEVSKAPTVGEKNALAKAQSYLRSSAFSEKRLYDQLIYEKFTDAEARYGVEHCGADWYEQAEKKAQSYLRSSAFSEKKLYDQLIYEKFTDAEARYGVEHCGADWYEQAEKKAQSYLSHMSFSKEKLYDQMIYEGFTQDQARKAVDKVYI